MASTSANRGPRSGDGRRTLIFRLEMLGFGSLLASQAVRLADSSSGGGDDGFFDNLPLAGLSVAFLVCIVGAGVVAAVGLWREPLRSSTGRWALGLAVFNVCLLPVVWVLSWAGAAVGLAFHVSWGMPTFPLWAVAGLLAIALALINPKERRQGATVVALILGAALLTFFLGDMVPMP